MMRLVFLVAGALCCAVLWAPQAFAAAPLNGDFANRDPTPVVSHFSIRPAHLGR